VGPGKLHFSFTGILNDKMRGFYRSKYTHPNGETRHGAVTQFEATDARRAFPCWDEPAVKATFDVTLVVPKDRVALSNMPVESETALESDSNLKVLKYGRTPVMSTYLLAFVVGEFDYVEAKDADNVLVRVYTPLGKKEQGQFALEVSCKTLPFYKNYFKLGYPLPKIDLIAIPDFALGAMENWGLVTYRETALLVDPENSSSSAKQWVALVVGHELAHQWFGNLVTMEWWTHLWLNEGFASFIEYLCVDHCFPEYDIWNQFASTDFTRALELDALKNSHAIEVPVGHPSEIDEIFDAISYSKGASVIRMLHDYIGDESFKKGLSDYLTKFSHKNTFTEDLWASLEQASGKPVAAIMNTWTKQMGFPVLKVSDKQEGSNRVLTITQEKFCADGKGDANDSSLWKVPVKICTASSPSIPVKILLLEEKSATVVLENVKPEDWVKVNPGSVAFYRTQYSTTMLEALLPGIRSHALSPRDRLGLQNDLFALAMAGTISAVDVFKVLPAFETEDNYTVWSDLATNLANMAVPLQYTDFFDSFKAFGCKLFDKIAQKLGWDPKPKESHLDAMLRGLVLGRLGTYGHEATVAEARKRFQAHAEGSTILPADLRGPTYTVVLKHGDDEVFEQLLKPKVSQVNLESSTRAPVLVVKSVQLARSPLTPGVLMVEWETLAAPESRNTQG
ncbi:puromycin-sensitive aminopeptidase, partial [Lingula anatina]|uniref:Puromycin-sensitive aminopeptidase n=1 Tax=Lingula anatina TaxID=7574 RepID=A0A2R2MQL4_LINAN